MAPIETYVFFDLGTTGKNKLNDDKITELCMIAVRRAHLLNVDTDARRYPRVQHKLTKCFNPEKEISYPYPAKRDGTGGFTNKDLENESPFNTTSTELIANFLDTLTAPVCLVAHCGNSFDYVIFRRCLFGLERFRHIMCVDSRNVFKTLEQNNTQRGNEAIGNIRNLSLKYDLSAVYERVMGHRPEDAHKAEADCKLMIEIAVKFGDRFAQEVDRVQRPFF